MAQLEDLKLSEEQAEAIVALGIKYGAYSDEMPESRKEKLAAADEIVSFSIDAYINDGITSEDDDEGVAESGRQIEEIMELAGVEIEDGQAVFNDPPDAEAEDEDEEDDSTEDESEEDSDEEPFNPNDYIEGYSDLSVVTKLKKVKELDADDDDDVAVLEAIADWENEQEKPSSRILNHIDEVLGTSEEDEEAPEEDEPEAEEESDEPWSREGDMKGYDESSATEIKQVLTEASEAGDLSAEQIEYVLEYEQNREKPPPRKRIIVFCNELLERLNNGDDAEDEPEDEPKPKRGRPRKEQAVAASNGKIVLSREMILTALAEGEITIDLGA